MSHKYDPLRDPLSMPVQTLRAQIVFERPWDLPTSVAGTFATSLRGALGEALRQTTCTSDTACTAGVDLCAGATGCDFPLLWCPSSLPQRRQHASPVVVDAPETVATGARKLTCRVTLWGRHAIARARIARAALRAAGGRGLDGHHGPIRFETNLHITYEGPVGAWRDIPDEGSSLTLRFPSRRTVAAEPARMVDRIADAAHDLVQWDLFDRGLDTALGKPGCDPLAEASREHVRALFAPLSLRDEVVIERAGRRRSGRNHHAFVVPRLAGALTLEGPLAPALPWLRAATLRGFGPKRAFTTRPTVHARRTPTAD
jgi:hypothetical protein